MSIDQSVVPFKHASELEYATTCPTIALCFGEGVAIAEIFAQRMQEIRKVLRMDVCLVCESTPNSDGHAEESESRITID